MATYGLFWEALNFETSPHTSNFNNFLALAPRYLGLVSAVECLVSADKNVATIWIRHAVS